MTTSFSASNLSAECCSCDSTQHTKIYILDSLLEKCTTLHPKCNEHWLSAYVTVGNLSWTMWNTSLGLQPGRLASRWLYSPSKYPATCTNLKSGSFEQKKRTPEPSDTLSFPENYSNVVHSNLPIQLTCQAYAIPTCPQFNARQKFQC